MRVVWFTRSLPALASAFVLTACVSVLPAVSPTPTPTIQPTPSPSPTAVPTLPPTEPPTLPPTEPPTAPPTEPPTTPPTLPPTAPPTEAPPTKPSGAEGEFDPNGHPNYGEKELQSGFVPDPHQKDMVSGGDVNARYLGGDCTGFATEQPDYRVIYTAGEANLLRFYFEGGDATLIINDPNGEWSCDDDSYSSVNPTVNFEQPISGQYDIWVGSYNQDQPLIGTLSVTELESNHP